MNQLKCCGNSHPLNKYPYRTCFKYRNITMNFISWERGITQSNWLTGIMWCLLCNHGAFLCTFSNTVVFLWNIIICVYSTPQNCRNMQLQGLMDHNYQIRVLWGSFWCLHLIAFWNSEWEKEHGYCSTEPHTRINFRRSRFYSHLR